MAIDLEIAYLSNEEILHIFKQVYHQGVRPNFLQSFAAALCLAETERDFHIMRGSALVFIAKYGLGCYLASFEGPEQQERSA